MLLSLNDFDTIIILRNDDEQCALEIEADSPVEMLAVLVPLEQLAQQAAEERDLAHIIHGSHWV